MSGYDKMDVRHRMEGAIRVLREEFQGLRSGRASASLLEPILVEAYGQKMRISEVGNVNVPEARMLSVQVWDEGNVKAVERALRESELGFNPAVDGSTVRVPLPDLTEERRMEYAKTADRYAESARVAIRNVRQTAMSALKRAQREDGMSDDEHRVASDEVQKFTDEFVGQVNELLETKRKDILQV